MIKTDKLNYSIKDNSILRDISISMYKGDIISVLGPNGAGKTTFIKLLRKFLKATSGEINIYNKNIDDFNNKELSKLISYLPQTTKAISCTVKDCIMLGRKPHMKFFPSQEDYIKCKNIIQNLQLEKYKEKNILKLSGGELQKVLIARSLVQESPILFLDEPINHLDIKNQLDIMNMTKEITRQRDISTIIVLHDLNLALKYSNKILLLKNGEKIFFGSKEKLSSEILSKAYGVDIKLINYKNEKKVIY